ncbi:hypothetical protein BWQ96_07766 [Gracilariopsis chorda]|uniref:Uncharacterized protein n=1 Tax=Gracilariopsis chorda TaxID=448386 RepID=A0A2V3IK80_9FLOR|nr:hypothetical protein BWQ96_07766 [Gracilariopsis chorda]|eukprot:PXF42504.1 hypothetical protein BWQ96_07766 [Gracilariopsis chorda]
MHERTPSNTMRKDIKANRTSMAPHLDNKEARHKSILLRLPIRPPPHNSHLSARRLQNITNVGDVLPTTVGATDALSTTVTALLAQAQECLQSMETGSSSAFNHGVRADRLSHSTRGRAQKGSKQNVIARRGRGGGRYRGRVSNRGGKKLIVRNQGATLGLGCRAKSKHLH